MLRVVDDDIERPYKNVPDIFDFVYSCGRFCMTLLTPHGGRHGACCVTSYGLHLVQHHGSSQQMAMTSPNE